MYFEVIWVFLTKLYNFFGYLFWFKNVTFLQYHKRVRKTPSPRNLTIQKKTKQIPIHTFLPQCLIVVRLFFFLFFVPVKEGNKVITVWCYQSEGLTKFNHLEVVVLLEIRKKEEIFPEEVLRVYRGILHLASKLGEYFTARIHLMTLS